MPISTSINPDSKLVFAIAHGRVTKEELYRYQEDTWLHHDHRGYNCVFDATCADFSGLNPDDLNLFSYRSAQVSKGIPDVRVAIIITQPHHEQLAGYYQTEVTKQVGDTRKTRIVNSMRDAMDFVTHPNLVDLH